MYVLVITLRLMYEFQSKIVTSGQNNAFKRSHFSFSKISARDCYPFNLPLFHETENWYLIRRLLYLSAKTVLVNQLSGSPGRRCNIHIWRDTQEADRIYPLWGQVYQYISLAVECRVPVRSSDQSISILAELLMNGHGGSGTVELFRW